MIKNKPFYIFLIVSYTCVVTTNPIYGFYSECKLGNHKQIENRIRCILETPDG